MNSRKDKENPIPFHNFAVLAISAATKEIKEMDKSQPGGLGKVIDSLVVKLGISEVCLRGPRVLNGIAPTQRDIDIMLKIDRRLRCVTLLADFYKDYVNQVSETQSRFIDYLSLLPPKPPTEEEQAVYNKLRGFSAGRDMIAIDPASLDPRDWPTHSIEEIDGKKYLTVHRGKHRRQSIPDNVEFKLVADPFKEGFNPLYVNVEPAETSQPKLKETPSEFITRLKAEPGGSIILKEMQGLVDRGRYPSLEAVAEEVQKGIPHFFKRELLKERQETEPQRVLNRYPSLRAVFKPGEVVIQVVPLKPTSPFMSEAELRLLNAIGKPVSIDISIINPEEEVSDGQEGQAKKT